MEAQAHIYGPVHKSLVDVTYAISEGPGEQADSCNT